MYIRLTACLLALVLGLTACGARPAQVAQQSAQGARATTTPRPTRVRPTRAKPSATARPPATARPQATATPIKPTLAPLPNQAVRTAFDTTTQAVVYRLHMSYGSVADGKGDGSQTMFDYHIAVDDDDYSYQYNAPAYSDMYGVSRVAMVRTEGTYYVRGPFPQQGLDQPVWYNVGRKSIGDMPLTAQLLFSSLRKGVNFADLSPDGSAELGGQTCERYLGDTKFTGDLMKGLMNLSKPNRQAMGSGKVVLRPSAQENGFRDAQTSIWVCPDGYARRIEVTASSPEVEDMFGVYTIQVVFEINDIDGEIEIVAPADAVRPGSRIWSAAVFNGGNLREQPSVGGRVLDQVNANEQVRLLAKSADGRWYRVSNQRDVSGWVSATLLTVDTEVAEAVPVE